MTIHWACLLMPFLHRKRENGELFNTGNIYHDILLIDIDFELIHPEKKKNVNIASCELNRIFHSVGTYYTEQ